MTGIPSDTSDDKLIGVTFFPSLTETDGDYDQRTLTELKELIAVTSADDKKHLPLLKLAHFKGPRSNENVEYINGIEIDIDNGKLTVEAVESRLLRNGIEALLHTTASHTIKHSRLRVLCPLSTSYAPSERERFVARMNGVFDGNVTSESFVSSQAYFYGHLTEDPDAYVSVVRGQCVDTRPDLDRNSKGKSGTKSSGSGDYSHSPLDMDEMIRRFMSGEEFHPSAIRMVGLWAHEGITKDVVLKLLQSMYDAALKSNPRYRQRWPELEAIVADIYAKEDKKYEGGDVEYGDFWAYLPEHKYIFIPTGSLWPAASVDGKLPMVSGIKPHKRLDLDRSVHQMTWAPGEGRLIEGKLIIDGGWLDRPGSKVYNLYRPPRLHIGRKENARPWIDHLFAIYPDEAEHILKWFACRCQRPRVKINHALVLGGSQGIGKDTLLEPVRHTLGYWNCATVSPIQLLGRFNSFLKSLLLVISEARDLGEINRPNFYEHTKSIIAAPPDVLLIDEKNTHPYYIPNITGVVITTNHKTSGIYLPAEDRRHFVAWSPSEIGDFDESYWIAIWGFYLNGGFGDIATYLMSYDLAGFDPKKPPPRTSAFHEIVVVGTAPENSELEDAIAKMGSPDALAISHLIGHASPEFVTWMLDHRNRRLLPRTFEACGYVIVNNPANKQGYWNVGGKRQIIYAKASLAGHARFAKARELSRQ